MAFNRTHADIALLGALLLTGTLLVRSWMEEDSPVKASAAPVPPPAPSRERPVRVVSDPPPSSRSGEPGIRLLETVRPELDAVAGPWSLVEGSLRTPAVPWGRLQFACDPPEEYDFRAVVTRLEHPDALILGMVFQGRQCQIVLDGNAGGGSWLEVKGGRNGITENGVTYFHGRVFEKDRPGDVLVSVRKDRLTVTIDSFLVLDWRGPKERLFLGENWDVPDRRALFIGSWKSVFAVADVILSPVTGSVQRLR